MFKKKVKCKNCSEKFNNSFSYCPACGTPTGKSKKEEDYGLLGKSDSVDPFEAFEKGMMGGISSKMLNKMLGGAMKMLENEMKRNMQNTNPQPFQPKTNFELYINGKRISPKNIKVTRREIPIKTQSQTTKHKTHTNYHFSEETQKQYAKMNKTEPVTNVRRLSNQVVYEVDIPGVESIKDVAVIKLENSIEIRAITKEKAYKKIIAVDLPLKRYKLENEKLILELGVKD